MILLTESVQKIDRCQPLFMGQRRLSDEIVEMIYQVLEKEFRPFIGAVGKAEMNHLRDSLDLIE